MIDAGEHRTAYLIARDAALPAKRHLQDRTGVHRGLDRAALPQRSGGRVPAFRPHRRRQPQPDSAGARRLLAGPRRGSRRPCAGGARRLYPRRRAIDQLLRPVGARKTRLAADRAEWRPARPRRRAARDRACGAVALRARRARARDPDSRRHGREWRSRCARRARRTDRALQRRPRHAADGQVRAQSRPAVRPSMPIRSTASPRSSSSGRKSSRASSTPSRGRKAPSTRRWSPLPRPTG